LQPGIIDAEQPLTALRVPRCDPNGKFPSTKTLNDVAPEKAAASKNGHDVDGHRGPFEGQAARHLHAT
jgi:hypothetical protein